MAETFLYSSAYIASNNHIETRHLSIDAILTYCLFLLILTHYIEGLCSWRIYLGCVCFRGKIHDGGKYIPLITFSWKDEYFLLFGDVSEK